MTPQVFDDTPCDLGEGALWHPERQQFFWFDINAHRLYTQGSSGRQMWQFDEYVSAAGWIDRDHLLIASETALLDFDITTGKYQPICALEADNLVTRSNDGRADPWGGFWIGTMGKEKTRDAGAIYRLYKGELRRLYAPWSIPNAICFTPDGGHAYLTDTPRLTLWRQRLDSQGWPDGEPEVLRQLDGNRYRPDGAVVDTDGTLWIAQYSHGAVTVLDPQGTEIERIALPAERPTCPGFGGADLSTLFVTTARQQMDAPSAADGLTYTVQTGTTGQAEHRVIL